MFLTLFLLFFAGMLNIVIVNSRLLEQKKMVVMFVKLHGLAHLNFKFQNYSTNQIHHNLVLSLKITKKL